MTLNRVLIPVWAFMTLFNACTAIASAAMIGKALALENDEALWLFVKASVIAALLVVFGVYQIKKLRAEHEQGKRTDSDVSGE